MKIKYCDYLNKTSFNKEELLAHAWGSLIEDPPEAGSPMLPAPPMLMFDRIVQVEKNGSKGRIVAEQDVKLDQWFFQCHFRKDPVQPGCLGVDAVWQLLGFYASLCGAVGVGRALGAKEIEFFGQIRPHNKMVKYDISVRRYMKSESIDTSFIIGSAVISVDDQEIYSIKEAKVGVFTNLQYDNYPHLSKNAVGGQIAR